MCPRSFFYDVNRIDYSVFELIFSQYDWFDFVFNILLSFTPLVSDCSVVDLMLEAYPSYYGPI